MVGLMAKGLAKGLAQGLATFGAKGLGIGTKADITHRGPCTMGPVAEEATKEYPHYCNIKHK